MDVTNDDWRMQALTHLTKDWTSPWTNEVSPKGTKVTVISSTKLNKRTQLTIALPNATALCLDSSRRAWKEASKIRKLSKIDKSLKKEVTFNSNAEAFDYIEMVMESVVMAYTALEAFVNENVPDDYKYHTHRKSEIIIEAMDKEQIERWLTLDEKFSSVLPEVLGIDSPKKQGCWSDFKKLQKIRHRIIHMKKEDRKSSGPDQPTLWHDIFKLEPPYRQAKKLIDFYIKSIENKPRWYGKYPKET